MNPNSKHVFDTFYLRKKIQEFFVNRISTYKFNFEKLSLKYFTKIQVILIYFISILYELYQYCIFSIIVIDG